MTEKEGAGDNPLTPAPLFLSRLLSRLFTLPKKSCKQDRFVTASLMPRNVGTGGSPVRFGGDRKIASRAGGPEVGTNFAHALAAHSL
jgi:hypothetical protein